MQVVDRAGFKSLPPNSLFVRFNPGPNDWPGLTIKGETLGDLCVEQVIDPNHWTVSDLGVYADALELRRREDGAPVFLVWEDADILNLIERLKMCLRNKEETET